MRFIRSVKAGIVRSLVRIVLQLPHQPSALLLARADIGPVLKELVYGNLDAGVHRLLLDGGFFRERVEQFRVEIDWHLHMVQRFSQSGLAPAMTLPGTLYQTGTRGKAAELER